MLIKKITFGKIWSSFWLGVGWAILFAIVVGWLWGMFSFAWLAPVWWGRLLLMIVYIFFSFIIGAIMFDD